MRMRLTVGAAVLTLAFGGAPAWAQSQGEGSRPSAGGQSTGQTAVPRGGEGSSGSSAGAGSSSSSGSPSSGTSASSPTPSASRPAPSSAPQRRGGDGSRGEGVRAVPRGSSEGGGRVGSQGRTAGEAGGSTEAVAAAPERRAVPAYSRPRDGRTPIGSAVERRDAPPRGGTIFLPRTGFWVPAGYPYGFGHFYYDPFWYGGFGYGGYGYGGYGYDPRYVTPGTPTGAIRLRVEPRHAQVYVNGYYVGIVDDFNGLFQRLRLEPGGHRLEIRAEGYEPEHVDVLVVAGETAVYQGQLRPRP